MSSIIPEGKMGWGPSKILGGEVIFFFFFRRTKEPDTILNNLFVLYEQ